MPQTSFWFNKENLQWLESAKEKHNIKINKLVNTVVRHAREADVGGQYLDSLIRDYDLVKKLQEEPQEDRRTIEEGRA